MGRVADETIRGAKWGLIQKFTMQPVQFLYGILLARLITPEEFGILGLTSIFFAVANALRDAGFGSALIRKQDRTEEDCSTMFWFNLGMSCLMGGILFLLAPWFADFYGEPDLLPLTRISAFMMCITCTAGVHWTLYTARRDFKTPAIVQMSVTLIGMPICLYFAFNGWGIWALVIQQVSTQTISLAIIWVISPWKPKFIWSNHSFRELFAFGSRLAIASLITRLYEDLKGFFIGKVYSPADLGLYGKGTSLCRTACYSATGVLDSVIYPILVTIQDDFIRLRHVFKTYVSTSAVVMLFLLTTVALNSQNLICCLYGETWTEAAVYAQIMCFCLMCNPLQIINGKLYLVRNRTDLTMKQEILIRCYGFPAICVGAYFSVVAICWAAVSIAVFALLMSTRTAARLLGIRQKDIYGAYFKYLAYSAVANLPGFFVVQVDGRGWIWLVVNVVSAVMIYVTILVAKRDMAGALLWGVLCEKISFLHRFSGK